MRERKNSQGGKYKRSWKNLLLDKRYQLRFTLFMVGMAVVLMAALVFGTAWIDRIWPDGARPTWLTKVTSKLDWGGVRGEADEATRVGEIGVLGERCPDVAPFLGSPEDDTADTTPPAQPGPPPAPTPMAVTGDTRSAAGSGEHHVRVEMTEESMTMVPTCDDHERNGNETDVDCGGSCSTKCLVGKSCAADADCALGSCRGGVCVQPQFGKTVHDHWKCEAVKWGKIDGLWRGYARILWVLAASCVLLVVGLAFYGIKMTHKVAGPLFKVSLYFKKMREGRLDKVYNLRKGDQLVEFYEHFKTAHAGIVTRERDDIARLEAIVAAAEEAGLGDHAATKQLRELIARKEKSLE